MEEAFASLKMETARMGLTIYSTKTKHMIADREGSRTSGVGAEVVLIRLKLLKNLFILEHL